MYQQKYIACQEIKSKDFFGEIKGYIVYEFVSFVLYSRKRNFIGKIIVVIFKVYCRYFIDPKKTKQKKIVATLSLLTAFSHTCIVG